VKQPSDFASATGLIRRAIALANAAADGDGGEEITPSEIAELIRDALLSHELEARVRRYLNEALDAVSDGMPPDYTVMILYSALGRLAES
jgi:DNA polymerase III delta prime subunit